MNESLLIALQELWRLTKSFLVGLATFLIVFYFFFSVLLHWHEWQYPNDHDGQAGMGLFVLALILATICSLVSTAIAYKKLKTKYGA